MANKRASHPEVRMSLYRSFAVLVASIAFVACSTPAGPEIVMSEADWDAVPDAIAAGGGEFTLTVTNQTAELQPFGVIYLYEGEPNSLPMVDGLLDLDNRNRVPGDANFWIVHPDYEALEGDGVDPPPLTPAEVSANSETTFTIGGPKGGGEPGTYVILSWVPGGYEAGHYVAFTITE